MPLFCKQCSNRRFPKWIKKENTTLWNCKKCGNYSDAEDTIIREDVI
jgi:DNA-directed RNA polymerase subunit M/transcription elongation factor TFIIS